MKILRLTLLLLTYLCLCYEKRCPYYSERRLYARTFCKGFSYLNYYCLFDENQDIYVESCSEEPDYVRAGYKYVITGKRRDLSCSGGMYQPFIFWSNVSSDCVFKKSTFSEIGQVLYNNGNNKEDRNVRCDYSKGYVFVSPIIQCYCSPSEEDCSCYRKTCTNNTKLSSDYNCVEEDNEWICPLIVTHRKPNEEDKHVHMSDLQQDDGKIRHGLSAVAWVVTFVIWTMILLKTLLFFDWLPSVSYIDINPPKFELKKNRNCIRLIWSPPKIPSLKIEKYNIQYTYDDWSNCVNIYVPANKHSYTLTEVLPQEIYRFRIITCICDTLKSNPSDEAFIHTGIPCSPSPAAASGEDGNIKVIWTRRQNTRFKISYYNIQYTCDDWKSQSEVNVGPENLSYLLTGIQLDVARTYRFRVCACTENDVKGHSCDAILPTGNSFYVNMQIDNPDINKYYYRRNPDINKYDNHVNISLSDEVKKHLQDGVNNVTGTDDTEIIIAGLSEGSLLVSFLLIYNDVQRETEIKTAIENAVRSGVLGIYTTKIETFSITVMHKPEPPQAVRVCLKNGEPIISWKRPIPIFFPITHYKIEITTDDWKSMTEKIIPADKQFYIIDTALLSRKFIYRIMTCTTNRMSSFTKDLVANIPEILGTNETDSNLTSSNESSIFAANCKDDSFLAHICFPGIESFHRKPRFIAIGF